MANVKSKRSTMSDPGQVVRAVSESFAELFVGFNDLIGDHLSSVADRFNMNNDDTEGDTAAAKGTGGRRRRRNFGNILRDSADVVSRGADRFRQVYDDNGEGDAPHPTETKAATK